MTTTLIIENVDLSLLKEQAKSLVKLAGELRYANNEQIYALRNVALMLEGWAERYEEATSASSIH